MFPGNSVINIFLRKVMAKDRNGDVRLEATIALAKMGDKKAINAIVAKLKHRLLVVRRGAARVLAELGDKRALPVLREIAAKDPTPKFRAWALKAIKKLEKRK